jgi:hypothetical protein
MKSISQVAKTKNRIRWSVSTPEDGHIGEAGADKQKSGWLWWSTVWDAAAKKDSTKEGHATDEDDALVRVSQSVGIKAPAARAIAANQKKPAKGKPCPYCGRVTR